jgi:DNA-binding NtrC family response regulator
MRSNSKTYFTRRVLVVDDNPAFRRMYTSMLLHDASIPNGMRIEVGAAGGAVEALDMLRDAARSGQPFHSLVTDFKMEPLSGLDLIARLRENDFTPDTLDVFLVSAQHALDRLEPTEAVRACWRGTGERDFEIVARADIPLEDFSIEKANPHREEFLNAVWAGLLGQFDRSRRRQFSVQRLPDPDGPWQEQFITRNPALIKSIGHLLDRAARTDEPVLITGQTGTGKDHLAALIHQHSSRCGKVLVEANLAELPDTLFEAEIFGWKKGAFTGAIEDRRGPFEEAKGGTLFLNEIGTVPLSLQAKLLKTLEKKRVKPIGTSRDVEVDFRLIAATNIDLTVAMSNKTFRSDLFYRINAFTIHLPPLDDRKEDIAPLAAMFWHRPTDSLPGREEPLEVQTLSALSATTWPGNVRQLRQMIKRLKVNTPDRFPTPADVAAVVKDAVPSGLAQLSGLTRSRHIMIFPALRQALMKAGNKIEAKRLLTQEVLKAWSPHFGEELEDAEEQLVKMVWPEHLRSCQICRKLWEQRFDN